MAWRILCLVIAFAVTEMFAAEGLIDAPQKLEALSRFGLHSIEQPVRAGQWEVMARLCASAPFPIALDEELIGINERARKIELLDTIRPQYIILKPSLHGGLHGAAEWIKLAAERGIGSWVTSALESNVGLNAIAQWCATLHPPTFHSATDRTACRCQRCFLAGRRSAEVGGFKPVRPALH